MIYSNKDVEKFLSKLSSDPASFCVQISPEGNLVYSGAKQISITDFIAVHDGHLWGRAGLTWLPSSPLPETPIPVCAFSLKRLAIFKGDSSVECISQKKEIDPGTSFLLCAKFTSGIRLLIADRSVGPQHIALTLHRDENGESFCGALIRQFVKHRLPEQSDALDILLKGGDTE